VPEFDEGLDLARLRDLQGRQAHPWIRRMLLALLTLIPVLALTGAFGQATRTRAASAPGARLHVELPDVLRGGLLWRGQITVDPDRVLRHPRLLLAPGFVKGMQLNTVEPSPTAESNSGRTLALSYDRIDPGHPLVVYLQLQVNPTTVGRQDTTVRLQDGDRTVVGIHHTTTVLP
jgi:hypothetical protein